MFSLDATTPLGRRGRIVTSHGTIDTPVFFPVATDGAMRGLTLEDTRALGSRVLLCNTYHLHLQPGEAVVKQAGGLHEFIGWDGPILTDSGGFQVFSLQDLLTIEEHGVRFKSHLDGSPLFLGPKEAMEIQHALGSDIIMCFDQCPPSTAPRATQEEAVDRTIRWAKECKEWHERLKNERPETGDRKMQESGKSGLGSPVSSPLLFGIVQGGLEKDLRRKCAEELIAIGFDGYAVGGLAVGETESEMYDVLDAVCPVLPEDKPRYLMGVGRVGQHREAVKRGIDMFDCVLPMREARHGKIHMKSGATINILNSEFRTDHSPIDSLSPTAMGRNHSKAYLAHLFRAKERAAETIACMQNMAVTLDAMDELRAAIDAQP